MTDNPYLTYAQSFQKITESGKALPYGKLSKLTKIELRMDAPVILIMSPHPDDECIMGPFPLRLMREAGFRVITCAITLGSNLSRRNERLSELKQACEWIGFEIQKVGEGGLDQITPFSRSNQPEEWSVNIEKIKNILTKWSPSAIFFPNSHDWNQTHLGVHLLTLDALAGIDDFFPFLIETEYWGQMPRPNLLVESSTRELADLMAALSHHKGELQRNPFHIRMPAWMQDNVRRGAEVVGGQGGQAPNFDFATLYRVSRWQQKCMVPAWQDGRMLPSSMNCSKIIASG